MNFRITGLSAAEFEHLFDLPESELAAMAIKRFVVDKKPGFPDRIELKDVEIGETVLLLNHVSQPAINPYRASHAIFIREAQRIPTTPSIKSRIPCEYGFCHCGRMTATT